MVCVAGANKVCRVGTPVVEVVVEGAQDVANAPLDILQMLCCPSLHEPTNIAYGEHQIWPRVGEVAKAPHKGTNTLWC